MGTPISVRIKGAKASARFLLQACPGIESDLDIGGFRFGLINFVKKDNNDITETELLDMIQYISWRNDQLRLADAIVHHLELELPSQQPIRTWNKGKWIDE
jgi:hypothetical protein